MPGPSKSAAKSPAQRPAKSPAKSPAQSPAQPAAIAALRRRVLAWYERERRDLPWRRSRDPYAIWLSEIMLQQTRVEVVIPYYERFLERFPTVETLAMAPLDAVLKMWAGLGYYSRARNLHAAAHAIMDRHAGRFPTDPEAIRALPGIGRYTAGAIASIAFDAPAPIVDGNVARVFARWFHVDDDMQSPATVKRLWAWAQEWAAGSSPGDANQALMELGALVCTKPIPACERCPVRTLCAASRADCAASLPRPKRRQEPSRVALDVLIAEHGSRLLLVRRASGRLLRDWWELPSAYGLTPELRPDANARSASPEVVRKTRARFRYAVGTARRLGATRHGILQHDLRVTIWHAAAGAPAKHRPSAAAPHARPAVRAQPIPSVGPTVHAQTASVDPAVGAIRRRATELANLELEGLEARWVTPRECRGLALATLTRKALREAAKQDSRWNGFLPRHRAGPPEGIPNAANSPRNESLPGSKALAGDRGRAELA